MAWQGGCQTDISKQVVEGDSALLPSNNGYDCLESPMVDVMDIADFPKRIRAEDPVPESLPDDTWGPDQTSVTARLPPIKQLTIPIRVDIQLEIQGDQRCRNDGIAERSCIGLASSRTTNRQQAFQICKKLRRLTWITMPIST